MLRSRKLVFTKCSTSNNSGIKAKFPCIETEIMHEVKFDSQNINFADFDALLLEAVDEVFSSLGNPAKKAIYFHLERDFEISKCQIPEKVEDFAKALESLLGLGAKLIEIQIMSRLYKKIGDLEYCAQKRRCNFSFTEYVAKLRKLYTKKFSL